MKWLNLITLLLVIIGGLDIGLVSLGGTHANDFIANLFGGVESNATRVVYALIGLSALWQLAPFFKAIKIGETHAELHR
jgi:uncharacterized membrane protein YuzA (DUF378 family)